MDPTPTTRGRSFAAISTVALLALLTVAAACGGGSGLEPRYRNFSAGNAALQIKDLPDGWQILDSDEIPPLERFLPDDADLKDGVLTIASTNQDDPSTIQLVAVGIGLLGGKEVPEGDQGLAGIALRGALKIDLSRLTFVSARPVNLPKPDSRRLQYSTLTPDGPALITDAINIHDGRILADIEIVHPANVEPSVDLEKLAAAVYDRIARQLVEE